MVLLRATTRAILVTESLMTVFKRLRICTALAVRASRPRPPPKCQCWALIGSVSYTMPGRCVQTVTTRSTMKFWGRGESVQSACHDCVFRKRLVQIIKCCLIYTVNSKGHALCASYLIQCVRRMWNTCFNSWNMHAVRSCARRARKRCLIHSNDRVAWGSLCVCIVSTPLKGPLPKDLLV